MHHPEYKNSSVLSVLEQDILLVEYPVMEHFFTIQGEGYHTGKASYFIRTAGCDVKCWWCDVKDSWDTEKHLAVHIETSGSSPVSGHLDWVTLSPKRFKKPVDEIYAYVDELKVVVLTKKDLKWAEEEASKCPEGAIHLLQPEWDTPGSMPLIVDYVKKNPRWGISLQTHKFLGVR
ncbi:MAG: 7-carboxy-7-deazaguanine synthase QueE [Rhodothermaceae bacterium]|nr:7-carboxy-7-deazaguanine synthase QueE [Rhodothermaceae bacterium]